jgi:hypothetical protein
MQNYSFDGEIDYRRRAQSGEKWSSGPVSWQLVRAAARTSLPAATQYARFDLHMSALRKRAAGLSQH